MMTFNPRRPVAALGFLALVTGVLPSPVRAQESAPPLEAELPPEGGFAPEPWIAVEEGVPVRSDAGFVYRELYLLHEGNEVLVDGRQGQWLHVRPEGWVFVGHVRRRSEPGSGAPAGRRLVVTRSGARVRSGPGTAHEVVDTLDEGAEVVAVGVENGWYALRGGGYLFAELARELARSGDAAGAASPAPTSWVVAVDSVNVRGGRGTEHPVVARRARGQAVTVRTVVDGWAELEGGGWIRLDMLAPGAATDVAPASAPAGAAATAVRRWSLVDLHGVRFEVRSLDPHRGFVPALRRELRSTGFLEDDWTYFKLVIAVPPGPYRFNYAPDHNTVVLQTSAGERYGNIYTRGPVERLPGHLRGFFLPQTIKQGERWEGVLLFRPTLRAGDVETVEMFIGGRLQRLFGGR